VLIVKPRFWTSLLRREAPAEHSGGSSAGARPLSFRPITLADIPEIMAIERSAYTYPWSERFFRQEMQVECARSFLAEIDSRIVGYILFWLLPDEVDIHNVAVHTEFRRRGLGRRLLQQAITDARDRGSSRITLEVRTSNLPAQRLYESLGFLVTGVRKGYYSDDGEDALLMTLKVRE
jgi:[ribosomal protein S18]-alanine N-acetyltransferase